MKIQILGTGCQKCKGLFDNAEKAVKDFNLNGTVEKIEDINEIMNFGVMITPAIAIDGVVKSAGKLLSPEKINDLIKGI